MKIIRGCYEAPKSEDLSCGHILLSAFPVSIHALATGGAHWSFIMNLLTGIWKPEGEGKRVRGERYINHASSICKLDDLTSALVQCQTHLAPENMTIWPSHLVLASCTLRTIRKNPPPGGTLFNYKPTNRVSPLPTSLSGFHPLGHCIPALLTAGPNMRQWGELLCSKPIEIIFSLVLNLLTLPHLFLLMETTMKFLLSVAVCPPFS